MFGDAERDRTVADLEGAAFGLGEPDRLAGERAVDVDERATHLRSGSTQAASGYGCDQIFSLECAAT
jgi:hypothetical protein